MINIKVLEIFLSILGGSGEVYSLKVHGEVKVIWHVKRCLNEFGPSMNLAE